MEAFWGILIPFLGTSLGAACVFFMKNSLSDMVQRVLTRFAAGVMVAASVWSLLIPSIEQSEGMGKLSFFPAVVGFWGGILFLLLLDYLIPHLHAKSDQPEGSKSQLRRTTMMVLAVTLHNIPEGMAVGVVYAGFLSGSAQITAAGALALSLGIAIQNFPEGAIISMPLRAEGMKKGRAFWGGVLSGVVEPIGAVLTILAAQLIVPALPYLLSFAAGAMLYVVVEELIPEMSLHLTQPCHGFQMSCRMTTSHESKHAVSFVQTSCFVLKHRVPRVQNADVGTDDLTAERCGLRCHVQRLAAVKGDGQVGADGTFGHLAGVRVDAAGQIHRQNKCTISMLTIYQRTGGKAGRTVTFQPSFAAARTMTKPSPPLLPFPQTTSRELGCGRAFFSST